MVEFNYADAFSEMYHGVGAVMDKIEDGLLFDLQEIRAQLLSIMLDAEEVLVLRK